MLEININRSLFDQLIWLKEITRIYFQYFTNADIALKLLNSFLHHWFPGILRNEIRRTGTREKFQEKKFA